MATVNYENGSSENNVSRKESTSSGSDDDPARKRSFSGGVRDIFDEEFLELLQTFSNDPRLKKKYEELAGFLRKSSDGFENRKYARLISYSDKTKNVLEKLYPRYDAKYQVLKRLVAQWKPNREKLIEKLSSDIYQLDRNFKLSTIVRILASSVEISGTAGGLMFRSEAGWANHALTVASFCGLCGLFSTVAEVDQSKRILDEVSEAIENDHRLLLPIVKWFEESDLDSIVQELFPHGIDTDIVRRIQEASAEQENYLKIFKAGLMSNLRKDNELLENADFLHSLQLFATSTVAAVWWNRYHYLLSVQNYEILPEIQQFKMGGKGVQRNLNFNLQVEIVYRKHPICLDLGRMALQIEFGQLQSIVFQCIPALPLEQQRLTSLPVAGRIMLNLLTLYDSIVDLKKGARSTHSEKLRRQLKTMQEQLDMIEGTVQMMRPNAL